MKRNPIKTLSWLLAVTAFGSLTATAADQPPPTPPDLTQGGKRDDNHDWRLGPTGMSGWIFGRNGQTAEARQILVTAVAKGSPADGILNGGDVILGVGGQRFSNDARIQFARAITAAEAKEGGLRLICWREGKIENVQLKVAVMGSYSNSAPYACPKSKKIFEQGCQTIAKNGLQGTGIDADLNALALLASGKEEYRPMLADYAKKVAASLHPGVWTWFKEQSWYYDLNRGWDGGFNYQGSPVGEEEHNKYTKWDCTGAYLLAYALPLKSLCLTGKQPCSVAPLNRAQVDEVIAAGRDYFSANGKNGYEYEGRKPAQLLAGLSSWSPAVRKRSAHSLGRCEGDFVPALLKLLAGSNRDARYGACEALGGLGPRAAAVAPQLRALLKDPDPWLQSLACTALPALGPEARKASVSDLLGMTVRSNPADPRHMAQRAACMALFAPYPGTAGQSPKSLLADSLEGVDRELLYPAIQSVLQNDDGAARMSLQGIYGKLTDRDLVALLPAIIKAIEKLAPSDEMFGDDIRLAGLDLVSRLHLREGMPLCVSVIEPDRWGSDRRLTKCLEYLGRYGVHATEVLPQLRELRRDLVKTDRKKEESEQVKLLDKCTAEIAASKASPTVLDLSAFTAGAPSDK